MNRAVSINARGLTPRDLSPARESGRPWRAADGPLRVLFLNAHELGFGTTSKMLEEHTASRDDIDAVHVHLRTRGLLRLASIQGDTQAWRASMAWGIQTAWWLRRGGRLPLDRFDVVHVMTQQRALGMTWAHARRDRRVTPYVVNIDATGLGWSREFYPPETINLRDPTIAVEKKVYARAAAVGCYSHWVVESVVREYEGDPSRIFIFMPCKEVPNAAQATRDRAQRLMARAAAAGAPREPLRIVFVGNDWERKGGPRLLKWHQQRWKDRAELHVCSGKVVPDRSAKNVVWHGGTPHDRLFGQVLPAMDLFVMPTYVDSLLLAAQEAQSSGLAVVSSRIAGIPEVVEDGATGFLCAPKDDEAYIRAVERLMDDPALLARMSEAALRRGQTELSSQRWLRHLMSNLARVAAGEPVQERPGPADATAPGSAGLAISARAAGEPAR